MKNCNDIINNGLDWIEKNRKSYASTTISIDLIGTFYIMIHNTKTCLFNWFDYNSRHLMESNDSQGNVEIYRTYKGNTGSPEDVNKFLKENNINIDKLVWHGI